MYDLGDDVGGDVGDDVGGDIGGDLGDDVGRDVGDDYMYALIKHGRIKYLLLFLKCLSFCICTNNKIYMHSV